MQRQGRSAAIVGHSRGGHFAKLLAMKRPERLTSERQHERASAADAAGGPKDSAARPRRRPPRRPARPKRATRAAAAAGSHGLGLADASDWWLDPHAPAQVAFAPAAAPPETEIAEPPRERAGRERMSSVDAAWLQMDRATNPMVVNVLLWYEQPVDWRAVRAILDRRIVARLARFRQRVGRDLVGRPRWEPDPGFALDLHLHRLALPAPGDQRALQRLLGDLVSQPLDRRKPLWDIYMIDGYGAGCALLIRVHHCVADGITLTQALSPLVGLSSEAGFAAPPAQDGGGPLGRLPLKGLLASGWRGASGLLRAGVGGVVHPRRLVSAAGAGGADVDALVRLLAGRPDAEGPLKQQPAAGQRVAWTQPLPLAEVKQAAHDSNATVNDLLVAALSGALGRYLRARRAGVDELHALMPINLRPRDQPLPRELGNRFGLLIVALPVGIRSQRKRLAAVKRNMDALKSSRQALVSHAILTALGLTPAQLETPAIDFFTAKATLVLTNVAGPPAPLQTAGTKIAGVLVWAPCSGSLGISTTILSYSGRVSIGVLTDLSLVPDPDQLVNHIETELQQLTTS